MVFFTKKHQDVNGRKQSVESHPSGRLIAEEVMSPVKVRFFSCKQLLDDARHWYNRVGIYLVNSSWDERSECVFCCHCEARSNLSVGNTISH